MSPQNTASDARFELPLDWKARHFQAMSKVMRLPDRTLAPETKQKAQDLTDQARFDEAIAVVEADPGWELSPEALIVVGNAYVGKGDEERARDSYENARDAARNWSAVFMSKVENNLGYIDLVQGRYAEAIKGFDLAIELSATWPMPWVNKIAALRLSGRDRELEALANDLYQRWPDWKASPAFAERLYNDPYVTESVRRLLLR